ncbi:MAG TPA: cupredoxin domain-containing protein [Mycobacteriales bacterium]|nr:cupredoxin domain-containing protein [Mycobacteriales bacterium]
MRIFAPRVQPVRLAAVLLVAAGAVAACGGSSGSGSTGAATSGNTGTATAAGPRHTVTVVETEFKLMLSRTSMPAGTYTFTAQNHGSAVHALEINGPGVANKSTADISPGESASITVTLQKGSYDVFCPVANHQMLGMDAHITVT